MDLSSLYSIRTFATKWVDNAPPRRLDMIVLCANTINPGSESKRMTVDNIDEEWQVNYLANYHLLSILSPALRAQPPDRDVRVIFSTCPSYMGAKLDFNTLEERVTTAAATAKDPRQNNRKTTTTTTTATEQENLYASSKLALMIFAKSFHSHLASYKRPDKYPPNVRVLMVDPGLCRTPGTRRWLTRGSLLGLFIYVLTWPMWWLILKSSQQGAQSFLMAVMDARFSGLADVDGSAERAAGIGGGKVIKECRERGVLRDEILDDGVGKSLWEISGKLVEKKEKEGAVRRALEKKEKEKEIEEQEKRKKENQSGDTGVSSGNKQRTPGSRRSKKGQ